jgi:hypothetical protein
MGDYVIMGILAKVDREFKIANSNPTPLEERRSHRIVCLDPCEAQILSQ